MSGLTTIGGTRRPRPLVARGVNRSTRTSRVVVGCLLAVAALAGCAAPSDPPAVTINSVSGADSPFHGTAITSPYVLPKATWTDTSGATVAWPTAGLAHPITVVFFAYTHCPDVCSTQLADVTQAIRGADPALRAKVGLVFVTVDPQRDDAATIRAFLDRFDPAYTGLRSDDTAMLVKAAESLGVALTGSSDTTHGYEVGHGAQLIGFGPAGNAPVIWLPGTPVGDIRTDLAMLARGA